MEEEKKELEQEEVAQEETAQEQTEETTEEKKEETFFENFTNTNDSTSQMDPKDVEENKVMGVLAYIWLLILVPLLAAPKSKFAKYHCNQALFLALLEIFSTIVCNLLGLIPGIGWLFFMIGGIVDLFCLIFAIIGIINAAEGKAKELPLIGGFKLINWENADKE